MGVKPGELGSEANEYSILFMNLRKVLRLLRLVIGKIFTVDTKLRTLGEGLRGRTFR